MTKTIVGLDFGHGVIRAAEVTTGGRRRPVVHRYHEVEIPVDAVKEGVVADEPAVVAALRWLWAVGGFKTKRVIIGMGSQQVLIRELTLPDMPAKHIRESLPFRVQDLLPLPAEQAMLDFFPIEEVDGEDGERLLRGLLVAATRESVLANVQALRGAGLTVVEVDLVPFAISRLHLTPETRGTKILAHIGAESTSVLVVEDGIPQFVRMLPSGGAEITGALSERLGVRPQEAEELKRKVGICRTAASADAASAEICAIGLDTARDFVQTLLATAAFYGNAHPDTVIDGIVLSGGGAALRGLSDHVAEATGVPVTIGRAIDGFELGTAVDEASFLAAGSGPTVALGLTMRSAA